MSFCKRQQNFCITNGRIIICRPIYTRDIRFPSNHFSITETGPRFISVLIDYIRIPLIIKLSHSCFMPSFKRKHQCHIQTTITILKFFHIIIRHQLWTGSKRFIIFFTQIFCIIPNFLIIGQTKRIADKIGIFLHFIRNIIMSKDNRLLLFLQRCNLIFDIHKTSSFQGKGCPTKTTLHVTTSLVQST